MLITTGIFPPDIGGPATYIPRFGEFLTSNNFEVEVVTLSETSVDLNSPFHFSVHRIMRSKKRLIRVIITVITIMNKLKDSNFLFSNGLYLEVSGTTEPAFVERSAVTGSVTETRVTQANWNIDKLDGNGPSGFTLDLTKAQILWFDIEWLGLGTVRAGFVINGAFIHCHSFHHANLTTSTYITTASLPLRYEITNVGTTASSSTLKQVCSTVLSEGGYELRGAQSAIGTPVASPRDLTSASTDYPVISIRLKSTRLDAIVILTALSIIGITNNANYNWKVIAGGTTTGGSWDNTGATSSVEYNITGTSFTLGTGRILASGFATGSNQGSSVIDILKEALFSFQLERNGLTSTAIELTLACSSASAGADVLSSMDWEEISR